MKTMYKITVCGRVEMIQVSHETNKMVTIVWTRALGGHGIRKERKENTDSFIAGTLNEAKSWLIARRTQGVENAQYNLDYAIKMLRAAEGLILDDVRQ